MTPTIDSSTRTEKEPATSIEKFMLCSSMPSPASAPRNSVTIAPINEKVTAISSPAKM